MLALRRNPSVRIGCESVSVSVLAVGDHSALNEDPKIAKIRGGIYFSTFGELDDELLETLRPEMIVSPLLARDFDCLDLARRLSDLGYQGQYRAMAERLPSPRIVQQEVQTICPDLDFDVLTIGDPDVETFRAL